MADRTLRHMRSLVVPALATLLLLAGCAAPAADPPADDEGRTSTMADEVAKFPRTGSDSFGWAAGVGTSGIEAISVMADHSVEINVPDGAKTVAITIEWTCAEPACGLDVRVGPEGKAKENLGTIASGSTIVLEEPEDGAWFVSLLSEGPTADIQGKVSWVIEGEAPTDDEA